MEKSARKSGIPFPGRMSFRSGALWQRRPERPLTRAGEWGFSIEAGVRFESNL